LDDPWLQGDTVIVKPNWVTTDPGAFTDCGTMRMLLEALDSSVVVVEGHQVVRCLSDVEDGLPFNIMSREHDWHWLHRGGWNYIAENDDWDWFKEGPHWDHLRKLDREFMDEKGFSDLFNELGAEYFNVTDEIWSGRTVDPAVIKGAVESRFRPVFDERLYGFVPKALYELRGSTLISFTKIKQYATFTMKNLFGLVPDPIRAWWHGPKNSRFDDSIVGINKVYESLFNVYGICEALRRTPIVNPEGKIKIPGYTYDVVEDIGMVAFGRDRVALDAVMCGLGGFEFKEVSYLEKACEMGRFDLGDVEKARSKRADWLLPTRPE